MSMGKNIKEMKSCQFSFQTVKGQMAPLGINMWRKNQEIDDKNIVDSFCEPNLIRH